MDAAGENPPWHSWGSFVRRRVDACSWRLGRTAALQKLGELLVTALVAPSVVV